MKRAPRRGRRRRGLRPIAILLFAALGAVGCGHARLERRLALLEVEADRQAVIELIHRYAQGLDRADHELLGRTFAADAVAEYVGANFPLNVRLEGLPAILEWLRATDRGRTPPSHFMGTHRVEVTGDRATLRTHQHNQNLSGVGLYTVAATRTPAGWRIAKLRLDTRALDPKWLQETSQENPDVRRSDDPEP